MDEFFERPVVWLLSAAVAGLVLLARCDVPEGYDPYAWQGATPDCCPSSSDGRTPSDYAEAPALRSSAPAEVYEYEMIANSLPPTGCYD